MSQFDPASIQTEEGSAHFLTNLSVPSSPIHELGHHKADPTWSELSRAGCKGILCGLVFHAAGLQLTSAYFTLPSILAMDTFFSDYSKELSYDHEYAREVWEHEYNSIGEVDEYVSYATERGLSPSKARDIAMTVTSEPSVSVPYHLAFELGLIQPTSYHRKLQHSMIVGAGVAAGFGGTRFLFRLGSSLASKSMFTGSRHMVTTALCLASLLPILSFRFGHVSRVGGARKFKASIGVCYAAAIGLVLYLGRQSS
jgi:hypothetical protein